jgi:hypothetical protein
MNNELLLLSKNDIPFVEAQVNIHQPTISEISLIGEENFFSACQLINFNKNRLPEEDRIGLENKSDFEIFMSIMRSKEKIQSRNSVLMLFALLFPSFQIKLADNEIILINSEMSTRINKINYNAFKDIIIEMFGLNDSDSTSTAYNPADTRAAKIAEKLERAKIKREKQSGKINKVAIFSRYISILAVGEQKDMNDFLQYTVFQLRDEFKRYQKKQAFDVYVQAKMAGAKDLDEVDNWMDDIHS